MIINVINSSNNNNNNNNDNNNNNNNNNANKNMFDITVENMNTNMVGRKRKRREEASGDKSVYKKTKNHFKMPRYGSIDKMKGIIF